MDTSTIGLLRGGSISISGWHNVGMAMLTESFRWAAFGMTGATTMGRHCVRINEAQHFLFEGTALDVALDIFGIGMTSDETRGLFQAWLRRRQTPYCP